MNEGDWYDWVEERCRKNDRVYKIQPVCPECNTKQVQILDVDLQEWRCRHCKHVFYTDEEI